MIGLRFSIAPAVLLLLESLARGELANAIEAVVDDSVITYHEVSALNQQTYETAFRKYRSDPQLLQRKMDTMRGENLESLLDRQLILHEFKTAGYALPESVIDDIVRERIKNQFNGDRATMTKQLEAEGITYERFRQQVRDQFVVEALRSKNISSEIIISPHKIEVYYDEHKDTYKVEDEVKVRVIVLKVSDDPNAPSAPKLGRDILSKLKEGAAFTEMASLYSQGSQRGQGGDWGWRERSKFTMGLADIAFALPVGKSSGLFSQSAGDDDYWIYQYEGLEPVSGKHYGVKPDTRKQVLLEERKLGEPDAMSKLPPPREFYLMYAEDSRPGHFKPLSEVREEIEKTLLDAERERLSKNWIDKLKKKTFVRTLF